jgi:signal transduction histidine kinase
MDGVVEDADHLAVILDDLLLAADTRGGQAIELVDVVVLAAQVIAASTPSAAERGISITGRPEQASALVEGSKGGLRRALTALVDNAIQHASSAVTVTINRAGGNVDVEVADDGPGIDPSMLPHLFERFTSTRKDRTERNQVRLRRHYGIGLALVSEIANRHRGSVTARNGEHGGASMRLNIPAATDQQRAHN